jgi:hypothetical protein
MASTNLTVLLDLRRAAEGEAQRALAEAAAALGRAESEQTRLQALVAQAKQALTADKQRRPAKASEGLARERYHQRLLAQREQAEAEAGKHRKGALRRARLAEASAAESLRQASLERRAAERLFEKLRAEQRLEAERREERRDEDWVQASHHQRKPR